MKGFQIAKEINADLKEKTLLKLDSSLFSILLKDNRPAAIQKVSPQR